MFGTIVVKMCDFAMRHARSMRWAVGDRAYWFFWKVRNTALGLGGDSEKRPCWYCVVGAKNRNDPDDVSCRYCLSGEVNPEAERWRQREEGFCWYCEVGAKHPDNGVPIKGCAKSPLADSLGVAPEQLDSRQCGCDRPRWKIRPCGHCSCASECDDCPANRIWKDEQESWCGCARPGYELLPCGHCRCGNGLCIEVVGDGEALEVRRRAACA